MTARQSTAPPPWSMTAFSVLVCTCAFIPITPVIRTALAALSLLTLMSLIALEGRSATAETRSDRPTPSERTSA